MQRLEGSSTTVLYRRTVLKG